MQTALITAACFLLIALTTPHEPRPRGAVAEALASRSEPQTLGMSRMDSAAASELGAPVDASVSNPFAARLLAKRGNKAPTDGLPLEPATAGYALAGAAFLGAVILSRRMRDHHQTRRHSHA